MSDSDISTLAHNRDTKLENGGNENVNTAPMIIGRSNSNASDPEEPTMGTGNGDRTLFNMLRSIKEKIKESNKSPKAYKPVGVEPPGSGKCSGEDEKGSITVTQNIAMENYIMLKALLAETKQNSSIDCL